VCVCVFLPKKSLMLTKAAFDQKYNIFLILFFILINRKCEPVEWCVNRFLRNKFSTDVP